MCSPNILFTYLFSSGSNTTASVFPLKLSLEKVKATVPFRYERLPLKLKRKQKTNKKNPLYLYGEINLSVKVIRVMREAKVPVDRCDLAFISHIFI